MKNNLKQEKELVRGDINIERWEVFTTRFYPFRTREIVKYEDGKEERVIIGKGPDGSEIGVLNAGDGRVFYGLLKFWETQGKPDSGRVIFRIQELLRTLGKKQKSKDVYVLLKEHLNRLVMIPIHWIESYEREGIKISTTFNLIDTCTIFVRNKDNPKKPYFGFSEVKINEEIIKTLKIKDIKPIRFDVIKDLKGDIAFILYRWLDITLYGVPVGGIFQRDLKEVAKICGIEKQSLKAIKIQIQRAIKQLEGKEMTSGVLKNLRIEESQTESGWKLVVEKEPLLQPIQIIDYHPELPETQLTGTDLAKELVLYFHEQLGHQEVKPTSLEISQAAKLIDEHGLEWTREFVDYVIDWLNNRGLDANVFGYVLTLLDEFKEHKANEEREKRKRIEEARREKEKKDREKREEEERIYWYKEILSLPRVIQRQVFKQALNALLEREKDNSFLIESIRKRSYGGRMTIKEEMIKIVKIFPVVTLRYVDSKAQDVKYAGDWTAWQPKPMDKKENGMWFKEIRLPAGAYKYKFVVDGVWISDPGGKSANDGFGNSVLRC